MAINVLQAAKHLCMMSDWTLTNLELQKVLYISYMFYLGRYGKPLFKNNFQAWRYGPVLPQLYNKFKKYGSDSIPESAFGRFIFDRVKDLDSEKEVDVLNEVIAAIPDNRGFRLVEITHWDNGAWTNKYQPFKNIPIKDADISKEYEAIQRL